MVTEKSGLWSDTGAQVPLVSEFIVSQGHLAFVILQANRFDFCCCVKPDGSEDKSSRTENSEGCLYGFVKNYYSHAILAEWVRPIVVSSVSLLLTL